ncbi:MAG: hypothetical protein ACXAAP_14810 [Candidatus Thorarchaeota archaeon]
MGRMTRREREAYHRYMHRDLKSQGFKWRFGRPDEFMRFGPNDIRKIERYYWHPQRLAERQERVNAGICQA